ncbi:hypothetical protein OUZ56_012419 [Daphnia magna]|uniref:Uncharacterized protein n=1 Tax=Daphnia magna TaxID=35525 RepID=A0ABQ9Z2Z0_9CRUS|nr:hypothetical protein OUZ56_012419 [Daphnia magna]
MVSIEFQKTFELYEILVLPVYDAKNGLGLRHSSLPQFLAVAGDQQTFIELSEEEEPVKIAQLSEGIIHFLGGPSVIPTEGYQLDAANGIDRQVPKIGVDVTTIYNRLDPWKERGSPNSDQEKQHHDLERIVVRMRLDALKKMSSVEATGDGEQTAEWSAQLDKLEDRIMEHEQYCMETL